MKSILKTLAFTALLLISKLTKEDEASITPERDLVSIMEPAEDAKANAVNEERTAPAEEQLQTLVLFPAVAE